MEFLKASEVATPEQAARIEYESIFEGIDQLRYFRIHHRDVFDALKDLEGDTQNFVEKHKLEEKAENVVKKADKFSKTVADNLKSKMEEIKR